MILLDFSQTVIGSYMGVAHGASEVDEDLLRHLVLSTIKTFRTKFHGEYGEMVICTDSSRNWRREIFPQYKANRKAKRKDDHTNWQHLFDCLNTIRDEIRDNFPYKVLHIDTAEADDIIGVLVKKYTEEPTLILSSDKDFIQLQKYAHVTQYSPMQKKYVKGDPKFSLYEKIIKGDSGDGVPNILSPDIVFVTEEMRQKPLTKKKLDAWYGVDPKDYCNEDMLRNWHRNSAMVDLDQIPSSICINILNDFEKQSFGDRSKLLSYFIKHRLKDLTENIQEF